MIPSLTRKHHKYQAVNQADCRAGNQGEQDGFPTEKSADHSHQLDVPKPHTLHLGDEVVAISHYEQGAGAYSDTDQRIEKSLGHHERAGQTDRNPGEGYPVGYDFQVDIDKGNDDHCAGVNEENQSNVGQYSFCTESHVKIIKPKHPCQQFNRKIPGAYFRFAMPALCAQQ